MLCSDGVLTKVKCKRTADGTHTRENAVIHSTQNDAEKFMREMKDVCEEWGVQIDTKPRASLSVRTWSSYTKQSLHEKFPECQVRVAGDNLIYMTASNKDLPLFEYLLQEGHPF